MQRSFGIPVLATHGFGPAQFSGVAGIIARALGGDDSDEALASLHEHVESPKTA